MVVVVVVVVRRSGGGGLFWSNSALSHLLIGICFFKVFIGASVLPGLGGCNVHHSVAPSSICEDSFLGSVSLISKSSSTTMEGHFDFKSPTQFGLDFHSCVKIFSGEAKCS